MSAMAYMISVVVSYSEDDPIDLLVQTLQAFHSQEGRGGRFDIHLSAWCGSNTASSRVHKALLRFDSLARGISVVECSSSFLSALPHSLTRLDQQTTTHVLLARCGVLPKPGCLPLLVDEVAEYDDGSSVLTASGYRLFPHEKLSSPLSELKRRVHYEFYSASHSTRAVHVFTLDFCCLGLPVLRSIKEKRSEDVDTSGFEHVWYSFVVGCCLGIPIWKLRLDKMLESSVTSSLGASLVDSSVTHRASFEKFYQQSYDSNWPMGISEVYYSREKMKAALDNQESCRDIWQRGFAGVNMLSEPASHLDFPAATSCGVRVIRVGAVGGAQDLMYLLDPSSTSAEDDKAHLLQVLPRLRRSLMEIGGHGMKTIVTVVDLPGSPFFSLKDDKVMCFWESEELQFRAVKFWGLLAENLADLRHLIMGYDIINEPYTQQDRDVSFFDETPTAHADTVNNFYRETVNEIRRHDKDTAIILKCTWFAVPFAMNILKPIPDPHVKYSFHCYLPPRLTLKRDQTKRYPGTVAAHPHCTFSQEVVIDKTYLRQFLTDHVVSWQVRHAIPSHQVFVAEFGMCREVPGAQDYLTDLVDIFSEFGWSWVLFSYRDEEWDALDYELGSDKSNMLYRSTCDMFLSVAKHFR